MSLRPVSPGDAPPPIQDSISKKLGRAAGALIVWAIFFGIVGAMIVGGTGLAWRFIRWAWE